MKVLIGCEHSGVLRRAFLEAGVEAYSCDLLPADDYSRYHIQKNILTVLNESADGEWDIFISHPPCTHLALSGARWWKDKLEKEPYLQINACAFARMLSETRKAKRTAVENPIGALSRLWRKPDQIIQPWMFGHGENKATCLWLRELPALIPTSINPIRMDRIHGKGETKYRWKERSRTYKGIAAAMAAQWSHVLRSNV